MYVASVQLGRRHVLLLHFKPEEVALATGILLTTHHPVRLQGIYASLWFPKFCAAWQ